jgi:hypothetical protein
MLGITEVGGEGKIGAVAQAPGYLEAAIAHASNTELETRAASHTGQPWCDLALA